MPYSQDGLEKMQAEFSACGGKRDDLFILIMRHAFKNERAREYATQGYMRRLNTLLRCLKNVFGIVPPDRADIPSRDELTDTAINVQAFLFNVFGCIDNLAWVWVQEHGWVHDKVIEFADGKEIPRVAVGFAPKSKEVRNTLPEDFRKYLESLGPWFEGLGEYRDALAHRVPLYIPFGVSKAKTEEYRRLGEDMSKAVQGGDWAAYDRLDAAQNNLMEFRPEMTHSLSEAKGTLLFHPQMLADFNLVVELGNRLVAALP